MKIKYYIIILLSSIQFATSQNEIQFLEMQSHSSFYKDNLYAKEAFKDFVKQEDFYLKFPKQIKSFEFNPDDNLKSFCKTCDLKTKNIDRHYNKAYKYKNIKTFWQDNLKICYAKYIQTAPEIRFAFELQNNTKVFHINTVSVYIYHARTPLSTEKNYFAHKDDEREKLIIDITKVNEEQIISLKQAHAIKEGGLALNLRLFPSEFWDGSFEKTKVLLHIRFKFTNGQEIQSEPFMVEM